MKKMLLKHFPYKLLCFSFTTKMLPFCAQGMFFVVLRVQDL